MGKFGYFCYEGLDKMGLTNPVSGYIMPKHRLRRFDYFPHMWYKGDMKVWRYGGLAARDYGAFFKSALYSTILHITPLLVCLII